MSAPTPALDALCTALGVVWSYIDGADRPCEAPPETRRAIVAALGHPAETEAAAAAALAALQADTPPLPPVLHAEAGAPAALPPGATLELEDGTEADPAAPLPPGLHRVHLGRHCAALIAAPSHLPLPPRRWGVTLPLYGLWQGTPAGLGDYALLAGAAEAAAAHGAAFLGLNPIHAGFPLDPTATSPYSPSHRSRLDTRHIAVPRAPAAPPGPLVDHAAELPAQRAALEAAFAAAPPDAAFHAWRAAEGPPLERFALHQALSEAHGPYWPAWPAALHDPAGPAATAFAAAHPDRVTFHAWAQWLAARQLGDAQARARAAGMRFGLYLDLAVGTHSAGAETWADPGLYAPTVSLGAPPDAFSATGQRWGLAPLRPDTLLDRGMEPFAAILRAQLRHSGLLRIDHILGFARAFWVPEGGLPGAYVTMPKAQLLATARLEAARAGATIVGEDLGAIPEGLRADLAASGLLGCRVVMFEQEEGGRFRPPQAYPEAVLASFATHDLPTFRGWRRGLEIDWRKRLGDIDARQATRFHAERRKAVRALDAATGEPGADAMHAFLAETPSALVAVQAEDVLDCDEQANLPGTIAVHPNWRRRLPVAVEALAADERLARTGRLMARAGRNERE